MKIDFEADARQEGGSLVLGLFRDEAPDCLAGTQGFSLTLAARAVAASRFTGAIGEHLDISGGESGSFARVVLAGLGARESYAPLPCEKIGGHLAAHLQALGEKQACVRLREATLPQPEQAARMAFGARLASYRFHRYRSTLRPGEAPSLETLVFVLPDCTQAHVQSAALDGLATAICAARDLVNEPPNVLDPAAFAEACKTLAPLGVEVEIMDEAELQARGFNALLAVGRGSAKESRLVTLHWRGAPPTQSPLAFVGKGVTFDTGGVSLKRAPGMDIMKFDMAGAAAVFGLIQTLAARGAPVNAVGILALAENMPDGNAWRPGDIVRSLSGQTIEVLDTDAEGRMLLADALWYAVKRFKPGLVVDIATLTGAVMAALNYQRGGLHANDEALAAQLLAAGEAEGERLWRLPLGDDYDALMDSRIADIRNSGPPGWGGGDGAGSTTAAQFLQRFVAGARWAHLDIPGVAWAHKAGPTQPEGPTGFGVRLLNRFVADLGAADGRVTAMAQPETSEYASGMLAVTHPHMLSWAQAGNSRGVPILFLHGGPGGRAQPAARALCDQAQWRIVQFDQRGCGRSMPAAETLANTTQDAVDDIETLRRHLDIERWALFGHSWGSALALAYAQQHPQRCLGLVVSAIYLGGPEEARWFFEGPRSVFPQAWEEMMAALAPAERADPLAAFHRMIESDDADTRRKAAAAIHAYDSWLSPFMPDAAPRRAADADAAFRYARIFLHYAASDFFLGDETLIGGAATLHDLPVEIVQGRYDLGVSMRPAHRLARALPNARFTVVADGAHAAADAGMRAALTAAIARTFLRITTESSAHGKD